MLVFYKNYDPGFLTYKREFRKALILGMDWDAIVDIVPFLSCTLIQQV
jgi:hypothetical protein